MADPVAPEPIPDSALLFRRIHRLFFDANSGHVSSGAFDGQEMSVDWDKYAAPQQTAAQDLSGNTVAVMALSALSCRRAEQVVVHDPLAANNGRPANHAHSLVCGRKSKPIKHKLRDAASLVWRRG